MQDLSCKMSLICMKMKKIVNGFARLARLVLTQNWLGNSKMAYTRIEGRWCPLPLNGYALLFSKNSYCSQFLLIQEWCIIPVLTNQNAEIFLCLIFLPTKWCFSFGFWLNIFSNCLQGLKKQSALISVFKERLYWNSVLCGSRSAQTLKKKDSCARLSILWKANSTNCRQVKKCNEINMRVMYFFGPSKIDKHLVT